MDMFKFYEILIYAGQEIMLCKPPVSVTPNPIVLFSCMNGKSAFAMAIMLPCVCYPTLVAGMTGYMYGDPNTKD